VILSLSRIADDPRIQRHAQALVGDGWQVTTVGFGKAGNGRSWLHRPVPELPSERSIRQRVARVCGLIASRASIRAAHWTWHQQPRYQALARSVSGLDAALVIACDHTSIPAAMALADASGAPLLYDSHEYAVCEKEENLIWRVLYPPYIRALEQTGLRQAADSITVSTGIATAMAHEYGLDRAPTVIRNLPFYCALPFRAPGDHIVVHHHGNLVPGRGLELLIASVPLWHSRFHLRLRGPIAPDYHVTLLARINRFGVADRVSIARPLAPKDLLADAWEADIGIHVLPDFGNQNRLALPNKLFEYLMAGLAVVTSNLPEMRRILQEYGVGVVTPAATPEGIASAINMLDTDRIAAYKKAALEAARSLCWEAEQGRFLELCRAVVTQPNTNVGQSSAELKRPLIM
jgi:glycosyltransferase involved in cell wall biosynthesis